MESQNIGSKNTVDIRMRRIISILQDKEYHTVEAIAQRLGCSEKTVRVAVKRFSDELEANGGRIESAYGRGLQLRIIDPNAFSASFERDLGDMIFRMPATNEERIQYLIWLFLDSREYIKIDDLSEQLYVTTRTLTMDLNQIEDILTANRLRFERKYGKSIRVVGDEFDIRLFIANYFKETILFDKKRIREVEQAMNRGLSNSQYALSGAAYHSLIIHIYTAMQRCNHGFAIQVSSGKRSYGFSEVCLFAAESILREIGEYTGTEFPRGEIESGRYQEVVFPEMGVRLIAVNDNYDSATGAGTDTAAFKNLFNDYYVRDISAKTKSALKARAAAGKYIAAGVYGYRKDPNDKNKLIPDPDTAPVVQRIFDMAISGYSYRSIAATLSNEGILTPLAVKGLSAKRETTRTNDWQYGTVNTIIHNPVYVGTLVYGRTRKASYKSNKKIFQSEEKYIVVPNAHEPIISQSVFDLANEITARHKKRDRTNEIHIFSGLLFCRDCACSESRVVSGRAARPAYVCRRYRDYGPSENGCTPHRISYDLLYATVLGSIQEVTEAARADRDELIEKLSGIGRKKQAAQLSAVKRSLATAENRLAKIDKLIRAAFEQSTTGELEANEYKRLMDGYREERAEIAEQRDTYAKQIAELSRETDNAQQFVSMVEEYVDITTLDRDLLHRLIDRIEIGQSYKENGVKYQPVDIYFRFVGKIEK